MTGCRKKLDGWHFCGETIQGSERPIFCDDCKNYNNSRNAKHLTYCELYRLERLKVAKQAERILNLRLKAEAANERANRAANDERKKYLPIVTKQAEQINLLRKALEKFVPIDEYGNGDFHYNEGSEYLGEEVMEALAATENKND